MASFYFDGNKLRIYEVPASSTYTVNPQGYRIYTPTGTPEPVVTFNVQKDLWSRFQDYVAFYSWSYLAFSRTGGGFRGYDELGNAKYQTNDFSLLTSVGWKIVLANYPHETIFRGNLFSDDGSSLFDYSRLTAQGIVPRIEGYDSLQTYVVSTEGGGDGFNSTDRNMLNALPTLDEIEASTVLAKESTARAAKNAAIANL